MQHNLTPFTAPLLKTKSKYMRVPSCKINVIKSTMLCSEPYIIILDSATPDPRATFGQ